MTRAYFAALFGVALLLCAPLLTVEYPPLVDYPNHLARCFILGNYDAVPQFAMRYSRVFQPLPNLAVDLLVSPLQSLFGTMAAGRLFLLLEILLFVAGVHVLGRAIQGRPTWLTIPLAFLVYNSMFLYGFVNYVFGVALFALALGLWIEWRARWTAPRLSMAAALILCAYLAHLSAFLFLGVAIGVIVTSDAVRRIRPMRDLVRDVVPLVPASAAAALYMRSNATTGVVIWNSLKGKVIGLLAMVAGYDNRFVAAIALSSVGVLLVAALLAKRITVANVSTLIAGSAIAVLFLVSPLVLLTGSPADARFVVPAALLLLLSFRAEFSPNTGRALLIVAFALGAIRLGEIWKTWMQLDTRIATEVARFDQIPRGATVFPVFEHGVEANRDKVDRALEHVVCYSVITRQALTPTLLALPTQQPIRFRQEHRFATLEHQDPNLWLRFVPDYDYVWTYGLDARLSAQLAQKANVISSGDGAILWRVQKNHA